MSSIVERLKQRVLARSALKRQTPMAIADSDLDEAAIAEIARLTTQRDALAGWLETALDELEEFYREQYGSGRKGREAHGSWIVARGLLARLSQADAVIKEAKGDE